MTTKQTDIEALAYSLWEARGRPDGSSDEDWLTAEKALTDRTTPSASPGSKIDESSMDSFPASDAPASHLPDNPPSNAGAKWAASAAASPKRRSGGRNS